MRVGLMSFLEVFSVLSSDAMRRIGIGVDALHELLDVQDDITRFNLYIMTLTNYWISIATIRSLELHSQASAIRRRDRSDPIGYCEIIRARPSLPASLTLVPGAADVSFDD
jgi:hypothetical protein